MWKLALPMVSGSLSVAGVPLVDTLTASTPLMYNWCTLFLTKRPHRCVHVLSGTGELCGVYALLPLKP